MTCSSTTRSSLQASEQERNGRMCSRSVRLELHVTAKLRPTVFRSLDRRPPTFSPLIHHLLSSTSTIAMSSTDQILSHVECTSLRPTVKLSSVATDRARPRSLPLQTSPEPPQRRLERFFTTASGPSLERPRRSRLSRWVLPSHLLLNARNELTMCPISSFLFSL